MAFLTPKSSASKSFNAEREPSPPDRGISAYQKDFIASALGVASRLALLSD